MQRSCVVIVLDRFHTGFVGPYGGRQVSTPHWNRFAAEGITFDQCYMNTDTDTASDHKDLPSPWSRLLGNPEVRSVLLTDDTEIMMSPRFQEFSEHHIIPLPNCMAPVRAEKDTHLFRCFQEAKQCLNSGVSRPYLLWCHFSSLGRCWDFPYSLRCQFQEDDDPTPYSETVPPDVYLDTDFDPDVRQSVVETYSAGITLADRFFGDFLQSTGLPDSSDTDSDTDAGEDCPLVVMMGCRGISLGEHGYIGVSLSSSSLSSSSLQPQEMWGTSFHVPLMIRFPDNFMASHRISGLLKTTDIYDIVAEWMMADTKNSEQKVLTMLEKSWETIQFQSTATATNRVTAVITPQWFLRQTNHRKQDGDQPVLTSFGEDSDFYSEYQLYAKPDDRYEVNNVADRCQDTVETLQKMTKHTVVFEE